MGLLYISVVFLYVVYKVCFIANRKFPEPDIALRATKFMVATQLSKEPLIRSAMRDVFFERAKIDVRPTKKGMKEVDENHPCYR